MATFYRVAILGATADLTVRQIAGLFQHQAGYMGVHVVMKVIPNGQSWADYLLITQVSCSLLSFVL